MTESRTVKDQLPYPYNQDLSTVLRHLDRRTPFSRQRLANDPVTAAYRAAAMRLVQRHAGPGAERVLVDPDDERSLTRPLLSFLSQRAVAAEVSANPDPFPRVGSTAGLRSSWKSQSDFIADLLAFGLWSLHQPMLSDNRIDAEAERLIDGPDFVETTHRLAYYNLVNLLTNSRFRLELIATAAADGDPVIREALAENRAGSVVAWKQLYEAVFEARGLRLRPGLTFDGLTEILTSLVTGFACRGVAGSDALAIDDERKRSLFGTGVLAIFMSCIVRVDQNEVDERTIDEAVTDLIYNLAVLTSREPSSHPET